MYEKKEKWRRKGGRQEDLQVFKGPEEDIKDIGRNAHYRGRGKRKGTGHSGKLEDGEGRNSAIPKRRVGGVPN